MNISHSSNEGSFRPRSLECYEVWKKLHTTTAQEIHSSDNSKHERREKIEQLMHAMKMNDGAIENLHVIFQDSDKENNLVLEKLMYAVQHDSLENLNTILKDSESFFLPEDITRNLYERLFQLGGKTPEHLRRYANFIGFWDQSRPASNPSDEVKALRQEAKLLEEKLHS